MMRFQRRRVLSAEEKAANAAKKVERSKRCATCQVCGRAVLANTGRIAHHGYQRPGNGWQTASCMGARELPYEVSADVLPGAIRSVTRHIEGVQGSLAQWIESPPKGIEWVDGHGSAYHTFKGTALRPDEFDPNAKLELDYRSGRAAQYRYPKLYQIRLAEFRSDIKASTDTKTYFEQRLAAWEPVMTLEQWWERTRAVN